MSKLFRILIVDDEPHVLKSFEKILKRNGKRNEKHDALQELEKALFNEQSKSEEGFSYSLTFCNQGEQAIMAIEESLQEDNPFAIAFLDVRMPPGIDGIVTGERIRKLDPDIEIVIVTAYSDTDVDEIARRIPPLDKLLFILKPFHPIEVVQFTAALATKWQHGRYLKSLHQQMEAELKFREDNIMVLYQRLQEDIQQRKRYEKQLKRHAIVFETMDEAVLISDLEGRMLDANPSFEKIYGYSKDEMMGKRLDKVHPNGEEVVNMILQSLKTKGYWNGELPIVRKNGRTGWVRINVKEYFDHDDHLIGFISVNRDITENKRTFDILKHQKNLLEDVFTRIQEGIGIVNEIEEYIFVNPSIARIYETTVEELLGRNVLEFVSEEENRKIMSQTAQRKKNIVSSYSLEITTVKGNRRIIQVSAYPRFDEHGDYQGAFGVILDITEQQRLREQFLQAQKMEAMGRLAGGIAHDFNNILTVISGSSELLRPSLSGDENEDYLDEINHAAMQAKQLVDQLLLFSRKQTMLPEIVNINQIIEDTQSFLKRIIGSNIQIDNILEKEMGLVEVDSGQFRQILMNFAVNSRDAMPDGGTITIQTRNITIDKKMKDTIPESRPGDFVSFSFTDTGKGIPDDVITQIFEPFFTTKAEHGTGLGLSTVFGIIQKHGGWINVESALNKGTRFTVYLPRIDSEFIPNEQQRHLESELKGNGETILVVQGNEAQRNFTAQALQDNGYIALTENSAAEAIKCFGHHRNEISMILTDSELTDSTGIILIESLKRKNHELKAVITSESADKPKEQEIGNGLPFLQKPYTEKDLLIVIKKGLWADVDVSDYCELYEICEFLNQLPPEQEYLNEGWKRMFCRNVLKSERCKRKIHFFEEGKQPDPRMTPTGHITEMK